MLKTVKNKGITLVALVITIIVLMILAGVTMNILLDENGLITKTKEAARLTEKERVKEKVNILLAEYEIKQATESQTLSAFLAEKVVSEEITEMIEETDDAFVIEVEGYEFTISKSTREITNVAETNIKISITYPDGTVGSTAKALVTVTNNKQTVDTSSLVYGWSSSKTVEPASWTNFTSGTEITHAIAGLELWFLWVKANYIGGTVGTESIKVSNQFNDADNTIPTISLNKTGDTAGTTSVEITATISYGFSGLKVLKWEAGQKTETDFEEEIGIVLTEPYKFTVEESGWYTVYIEGNNGKKAISTIQVINMIARGWRVGIPNVPEVIEGMIPIKYNGTNWVVTTTSDTDWYNYIDNTTENATISTTTEGQACRKWANVMLSDGTYKASTVTVGQQITDAQLGSMLVWIPRYSYKITSGEHTSTVGTIAIKFSNEITDDTSAGYIKHPAFTFGTQDLKGIWVGKFEPSNNSNNIKIVPNVVNWKGMDISTIFTKVRSMEKTNIYGWTAQAGTLETTGEITGDTNDFNTHMMKNTEWGAVAYLAHSIGKTGEVSINSNSSFYTGGGNYKTNISQSTTGNIYGIYDMSGGAYDLVMGALSTDTSGGTPTISNSGFTTIPDAKYYDLYARGATESHANNYAANANKKGDALYETSSSSSAFTSWNGDHSYFIIATDSWFKRGGVYTLGANCRRI